MFCPNTIQFEPVDSNRSFLLFIFINRHEMNRHFLSTKYNALFTYNIVYILMKIIKNSVFLTDSDLLLFT